MLSKFLLCSTGTQTWWFYSTGMPEFMHNSGMMVCLKMGMEMYHLMHANSIQRGHVMTEVLPYNQKYRHL